MKKCLTLIALMLSLASFANSSGNLKSTAPWSIKSPKVDVKQWTNPFHQTKMFDAYVTHYYGEITGAFPNRTFKLTVQLNQSPGEPWMATVQVFGIWYGLPGYPNSATYKIFDVLFNSSQWQKTISYPMTPSEEAYVGVMDLIYDGPQ